MVGPGRAGQARLRAINAHPGLECAGVVARTPSDTTRTWASVLEDPAVDAVVISTPNTLHPALAGEALRAGKHVAVEFPLAPTVASARELFELAAAHGRVLHVEHIELLSPSQAALRARVDEVGAPVSGEVRFAADAEGWVADDSTAGSPALRAVARLHRIVDLFGDARVIDATLERPPGGYTLAVELAFATGTVTLVEARAPGLARGTVWAIRCVRGQLVSPPREAPGALFDRDTQIFVDRVLRGAPSYVSDDRILAVLGLVEAAERQSRT